VLYIYIYIYNFFLKYKNENSTLLLGHFAQISFCCLVALLCRVARLKLPNSQVYYMSTFSSCQLTLLFCYFVKLQNPFHFMDCPNELKATHKIKCFWVVQGLTVFSDLPKLLCKKMRLPLKKCVFSTCCLGLFPPHLSPPVFFVHIFL